MASESGQAVTLATLEPPSTRTVRLSGPAHNIAVTGEGTAVATLPARGRVAFVRDGAAREIDLDGSPHDVKSAGGVVVVTDEEAARVVLVRRDRSTQAEVSLRDRPHDVAVAPDGRTAWMSLNGRR